MRLLLTTDTVGGVWTFTKELANGLLQRGCHILLVSLGRAPSPEQIASADELHASWPGHFRFVASEAPLEWMAANESAYTAAEPLLLELCREFHPDALLLSQFCFGALPVPAPKIVIAHSDVFSWAAAVGEAPLAEDTWLRTYRRLVEAGLDGADSVVAPTAAMLHDLRAHLRVKSPCCVIPNSRSLPHTASKPVRRLQAVTAGRMWDKAKNLRLLHDVSTAMPILVAGERSEDATPDVPFRSVGHLCESDLLALFRESAIYLCTSRYEPFGLAPLEAALCGCAVLAHDIPSLREVWGDGALYFSDAAALSLLLQRLCDDAGALAHAAQKALRRAKTYTTDAMTSRYLQHVQSLVSSRSAVHAA